MTIAISLKAHDGVVLAADSATTVFGTDPSGTTIGVLNVYNNANKIFNLYKGCPIGAITWGAGSIGQASISTLAKDLRRLLMGTAPGTEDWRIDPSDYTIEEVARKVRRFMFEEKYAPIFAEAGTKPDLGILVAGYSAGADLAEEWLVQIAGGECPDPKPVRSREATGINWHGQIEPLTRLILGHGTGLPQVLAELGVPEDQIGPAMQRIRESLQVPFLPPPIPVQDAIDLATYLVDTAVSFYRFSPGAPTVGGPTEIAAITKHEGFR